MDSVFAQLLDAKAPKMNPKAMNGMAVERVKTLPDYIDSVWRSASKSFPPGLIYHGYERCTPTEEFLESTRDRNNRRTYDIARSDIYLCRYLFSFNGEKLPPRHVYLPHLSEGGLIWLGGSPHHVSPVLSDKVISIGFDSIFIRLLRDKLTFKRLYHGFKYNGIREVAHVVWSQIYRNSSSKRKVPPTTKAQTTILHYLFARLGVNAALERLIGPGFILGEKEIDNTTYPADKWVVCQSDQIKPKTFLGDFYHPTELRIAIPKANWNASLKSIIASVYYLLDHFPSRLKIKDLENTSLWMILLGHIVFSGNYTDGKLYDSINEHFSTLEDYVDEIVVRKLNECGYNITNFYDLLILVMKNSNDWIVGNQNNITSIYGKDLEIDYYIVYELTIGIFRFIFNLNKTAVRKQLTKKDIIDLLSKNVKTGAIYKLTSGNLAVSSANYSGDNKYPKITAIVAEQESLPGPKRGKHKRRVPNITKRFHTSMLNLGSLLYMPKSNPTPIARINPYTQIDSNTAVITPKLFPEILEQAQRMLDGNMPEDLAK